MPRWPGAGFLPALLPVAGAIGVFGVVYGAAAQPILGTPLTLVASVLVFSGAAQFSMLGLLAAGASPAAVLGAVAVLDLRHLALGAVIRSRLEAGWGKRIALAWFLIDETVGLALTGGREAGSTLARAGVACYGAWVTGTALGLAGSRVPGLESVAEAVFPVLFIGLAALTAPDRSVAVRALLAGVAVLGLLAVWPAPGGLAPLAVALAVAVPGGRR